MRPVRHVPFAGAVVLVALVLAGCDAGTTGSDSSSGSKVPTTSRAMAAAVIEHVGGTPVAAAPRFARDGVPEGAKEVEVAFKSADGDRTHVRLSLLHSTGGSLTCPLDGDPFPCSTSVVGGETVRLQWQPGDSQEDPGAVLVDARAGGTRCVVVAFGPVVEGDPRRSGLAGLTKRLIALAADREVGFRTTTAYVRAGRQISDRVWLDWYGQGNGAPAPPGYRGPGAGAGAYEKG